LKIAEEKEAARIARVRYESEMTTSAEEKALRVKELKLAAKAHATE